ncbi:MAG: class I SAM-dependent methyltransferase [Pseudoxanthomonas sp.]
MNTRTGNAGAIAAWNTVLFDKFSRYEHLLVQGLGQHGSQLFERFPPGPGARVLDIGAGFGDSTIRLAALVGSKGEAVGVDCAENFVNAARERAQAQGARRIRFFCADAEVDPLDGPYDAAFARFGTMFFASPVAALRNIRNSLAPGARLAASAWRRREDNPCFHLAQQVVERFIDDADKSKDEVTCGPGPFSWASTDLVSDQLLAAGFIEPAFARFDAPMCIGASLDEALDFARDIGPAGETIRLAREKSGALHREIETALRSAFQPFLRDNGVWAMSSTWLVTARVP